MARNQVVEDILNYTFQDETLLNEAFIAEGAGVSRSRQNARQHGHKALAMIGDCLLRLVIVDDSILAGSTRGKGRR